MMFVPVERRNVLTMMDRLIDCRLDVPITANSLCDLSLDRAPQSGSR